VSTIFRRHAESFRASHVLPRQQARVLAAVSSCRTARLGGFLDVCMHCGQVKPVFHSCRDRHCPTCQSWDQDDWILDRTEKVLPCGHFHAVFTLHPALRPIAMRNPKLVYDLMFAAVSETLLVLGRDKLGALIGATLVLHTWTREMLYHPHVHCIVTGGGLSFDGSSWVRTARRRFLFPVGAMRRLFREILRRGLRAAFDRGELDLGGSCSQWQSPTGFRALLRSLYAKNWVVYCKAPFAGPEHVFQYLGRYTHRVAISDQRLVEVSDERVVFRTRGAQTASVTPHEFIRRFLLHVLPKGFHKIRHLGLYASSRLYSELVTAHRLLGLRPPPEPAPDSPAALRRARRRAAPTCSGCGSPVRRMPLAALHVLHLPGWPTPAPSAPDTS
jgi:hypothetical protein